MPEGDPAGYLPSVKRSRKRIPPNHKQQMVDAMRQARGSLQSITGSNQRQKGGSPPFRDPRIRPGGNQATPKNDLRQRQPGGSPPFMRPVPVDTQGGSLRMKKVDAPEGRYSPRAERDAQRTRLEREHKAKKRELGRARSYSGGLGKYQNSKFNPFANGGVSAGQRIRRGSSNRPAEDDSDFNPRRHGNRRYEGRRG